MRGGKGRTDWKGGGREGDAVPYLPGLVHRMGTVQMSKEFQPRQHDLFFVPKDKIRTLKLCLVFSGKKSFFLHALCDAFSRRQSCTTAAAAASKPPRLGLHAYYSEDTAEAEAERERAFVSAEEEEEEEEE